MRGYSTDQSINQGPVRMLKAAGISWKTAMALSELTAIPMSQVMMYLNMAFFITGYKQTPNTAQLQTKQVKASPMPHVSSGRGGGCIFL